MVTGSYTAVGHSYRFDSTCSGAQTQGKKKRWWVRPWISRRRQMGAFLHLMQELHLTCPEDYSRFLRMDRDVFYELVDRLRIPLTAASSEWQRQPLIPELKLAITLRYMASGESYMSLAYLFRVASNTISVLIPKVCDAIVENMMAEVIQLPTDAEGWKRVAHGFQSRWNFPHTLGAIDGKHIAIKKPASTGSLYHNYKGFFSIVLLAVVDADYKFIWADIGGEGSISDCSIFNQSSFKEAIEQNRLGIPEPEPLLPNEPPLPYYFVGDDAFPLKHWMMKPYSRRNLTKEQRIFNYRLSRARRIIENAFGILANRCRCFLTTMQQEPQNVAKILRASICLHNYLRIRTRDGDNIVDREDEAHNILPGDWQQNANLPDMQLHSQTYGTKENRDQRDYLKNYVNSQDGAVFWQDLMV